MTRNEKIALMLEGKTLAEIEQIRKRHNKRLRRKREARKGKAA